MKQVTHLDYNFMKKVWVSLGVLLTCVILYLPNSSFAQKKKRTTINFEDQLVEGEVKKPELFFLLQKKQFNFGRLIKLRENFVPEMRKSAEDVQRGGAR